MNPAATTLLVLPAAAFFAEPLQLACQLFKLQSIVLLAIVALE